MDRLNVLYEKWKLLSSLQNFGGQVKAETCLKDEWFRVGKREERKNRSEEEKKRYSKRRVWKFSSRTLSPQTFVMPRSVANHSLFT